MKRSSGPRKTANLSDSFNHRLNSYALAASAAGVSVLALSQLAQAKIIYTPAHVKFDHDTTYYIDLDHDRVEDFVIVWYGFSTSGYFGTKLGAGAADGRKGFDLVGRVPYASALPAGATIGPKQVFSHYAIRMATFLYHSGSRHFYGLWANGGIGLRNHYLGFRFLSKGATHYGWFRMNVSFPMVGNHESVSGLLTGYAYETIPNKPIIAGKTKGSDVATVSPASLGHLAAGASAIPSWRMKQTTATSH
jgi:hypothetical protein